MKENVYEVPATEVKISPLMQISAVDSIKVAIIGATLGLVSSGLAMIMYQFVFRTVLCRPQSITECSQAPVYAGVVATIIGAIAGIIILARIRAYRPLLVVLASTIALWGVLGWMDKMSWIWLLLSSALLYGLVYSLFAWVARIREFVLASVISIVLVIIVRLIVFN